MNLGEHNPAHNTSIFRPVCHQILQITGCPRPVTVTPPPPPPRPHEHILTPPSHFPHSFWTSQKYLVIQAQVTWQIRPCTQTYHPPGCKIRSGFWLLASFFDSAYCRIIVLQFLWPFRKLFPSKCFSTVK